MPLKSLKITPELDQLLKLALAEDVGTGDVTSEATIPDDQRGEGRIFAKKPGVLCGVDVARRIMHLVDPQTKMRLLIPDGTQLKPGMEIALLSGRMRSILTAERLMLNFLQQLSGVATLTRQYVDTLSALGSTMKVADTRKTVPLWRMLQKYAVLVGGGTNHRFALYDMYLIKNNHVDASGGVRQALERVWAHNKKRKLKVAVEARDLQEVRDSLEVGADLIMLDNMPPAQIRQAVRLIDGQAVTEITGGISLAKLKTLAKLPVDRISVGRLTHSAPALDIALHIQQS